MAVSFCCRTLLVASEDDDVNGVDRSRNDLDCIRGAVRHLPVLVLIPNEFEL